jgi:hypothetical protein
LAAARKDQAMPGTLKRICVFCSASAGTVPAHLALARKTGAALASRGIALVYGGGPDGLMGALARGCLDAGGEVLAVLPGFLAERERPTAGVSERILTRDLFERKQVMIELSDAFLLLPGGLGTLDEFFEVVSWAGLDLHHKPIVIVNPDGFWTPLLHLLDHLNGHGFIGPSSRPLWHQADSVEASLAMLTGSTI